MVILNKSIILVSLLFSHLTFANSLCPALFDEAKPKAQIIEQELTSLDSLAKAMTESLRLNEGQEALFQLYRKIYFGKAGTSLNNYKLSDVHKILAKYPELAKPALREQLLAVEKKVYESPEALNEFIESFRKSASQVRSNLFQVEANLGYWMKLFSAKELELEKPTKEMPKEEARTLREKNKALQAKHSRQFYKILDLVVDKESREFLKDTKKEDSEKIDILYKTLEAMREWMLKRGRPVAEISQAMVDLVNTSGFGNSFYVEQLKAKDALVRMEAIINILAERDSQAMRLGYEGHFQEMLEKLNVDHPTGFSKNEKLSDVIRNLEMNILAQTYTSEKAEVIRVRQLSIEEAAFRSCLGGSDCSSRTYFYKALDPNYIYFTMTGADHKSSGHITLVLGTATDTKGQTRKVAFVDKMQNVPNQYIIPMLEAVRRSLEEYGYEIGLPKDVGDHNGLSNESITRDFVITEVLAKQESESLSSFKPHENKYDFKNEYSRAYSSLDMYLLRPKEVIEGFSISAGEIKAVRRAPQDLEPRQLFEEILALRESKKEEDQIRYVESIEGIANIKEANIDKDFVVSSLKEILSEPINTTQVRKKILYKLIELEVLHLEDVVKLLNDLFTNQEFTQIEGEMKNWRSSSKAYQKEFIKEISGEVFEYVYEQNLAGLRTYVDSFLGRLSDINVKDGYGDTALMLAVSKGQTEIAVELLKRSDIDVNAENGDGRTALMQAAMRDKTEILRELLKRPEIDINAKAKGGYTALMLAAIEGQTEIAMELLNRSDIDVNAKDGNGNTALMGAAYRGRTEIVVALLKRSDVDVNAKDRWNDTALMNGRAYGHTGIVMELLKRSDIDVNAKDRNGNTALILAAIEGQTEIVRELLKRSDIDANAKDRDGNTALMLAGIEGQTEIVRELLNRSDVDVNAKDGDGFTALMEAATRGKQEIVRGLLKRLDVDVNAKNRIGDTALRIAQRGGLIGIVRLLEERGARR